MKLLVFGKTGQVGHALHTLRPEATYLTRMDADLAEPQICAEAIATHKPDAVINAAAYTNVDGAEDDEAFAAVINGEAPGAMAQACHDLGIPFVHISTDYVFDGQRKGSWKPDDPTSPLGAYGRSKLQGEEDVVAIGGTYAIMRTAWVFSHHGNNFLKTMLRLGGEREHLTIVADQYGGPTPAIDIAQAALAIAEELIADPKKSGIYHFTGTPDTNWADFARSIFQAAEMDCVVEGIPASQFPTKAKRPANSTLDCTSSETTFGLQRPDWREGIKQALAAL